MKKFNICSTFIVLLLIVSLLAGCGQTPKDSSGGPASDSTEATESEGKDKDSDVTEAEPTVKAPDELEVYIMFRSPDTNPDNFSIHYLEEKTNTKLNLTVLPEKEPEQKLNLLLASGERPDMIHFSTNETEDQFIQAGMLLPISDYFSKYPNLNAFGEPNIWNAMEYTDGKVYSVPVKNEPNDYVIIYRQDWLDNLGIKVPETIDQYYSLAKAIATQDPDKNGKADTYALGGRGTISSMYDHIFGAYGTLPNYWIEKDGKLVNGSVAPEAKEALKFLNKLYSEKLMDPEFATDNSDRFAEKLNKGRFGAAYWYYYMIDKNNIYNNYQPFAEQNPGAVLTPGEPLKGPDGANYGMRSYSLRGWRKTAILSTTKNADACLRILDWTASEEGQMFCNYGVEGEHYTMENGVVKQLVDADKQKELGICEVYFSMEELLLHTSPELQKAIEIGNRTATPDLTDGFRSPEIDQYTGDLKDLANVNFMRMINGEIPIDGGFEEMVDQWYENGGEEMTKAVNEEYSARQK